MGHSRSPMGASVDAEDAATDILTLKIDIIIVGVVGRIVTEGLCGNRSLRRKQAETKQRAEDEQRVQTALLADGFETATGGIVAAFADAA